ncbi:2-C-methyl-D-erythritol 4-phosphate cytidylyltransferase [[Mannheimia] succiniciproducens]|uniref:2-C-methyl-D-erythritol 4-phosphate cytidylyltransferase n=1 Tax=Mannheimia succiniciproducens (strain KCTC 0769BP / MBEL55E) TaxID=221988 RepID=ISPD_MANSM|nr:2-C-methyl-D-erythritol 4-phosphate cytidylyltransferase [[Mannheimia] succiniciproducens]Q65Q78.1 RecName: Full=2-C-methyl-D-erythritol 4-phosphate cytidylyltransferase; AltName: Full=4-diphosphocytidyl-2C-methyl-D-erythritol synthase; AltName: Full=MEP cytidylyltransferase; Short=MCT [[Mannheimia] succiniciproducens MBEL55E]AAU38882.1 IspD protein [[Mannheimia] succiniciproducens MBEL55E]
MTRHSRPIIAVVPAAGVGSRMQADKPKQYLTLLGKTLLEHTLEVLLSYTPIQQIILAVAENDPYLDQLDVIRQPKIKIVQGGRDRAGSVFNGLKAITQPHAWVMVHDAARPCLTHEDLDKLLQIEDDNGGILAIPAVDTIKRASAEKQIIQTEDRSQLWQAQTPQFFRADLLYRALQQAFEHGLAVTDEASAMEFAGFRPHLVAGRSDNLKVTRPEDLKLAEFYLSRK